MSFAFPLAYLRLAHVKQLSTVNRKVNLLVCTLRVQLKAFLFHYVQAVDLTLYLFDVINLPLRVVLLQSANTRIILFSF